MKSGKIIALISAVVILGIGTVFVLTKLPDKNNDNSVVDSTGSVSGSQAVKLNNKTYDENNIGELYYSPIDKDHVAEDENGIMYSDNEILLVSNDGVAKADIEKLAEDYNAEIVGYIEQTGDYQLKLSEEYTLDELDKLAEDIQKEDIVSSAYANYICEMSEDSVDIINVGDEWRKNIISGAINFFSGDTMWGAKAINAPQAWYAMDLLKENIEPVKVGLIDTGFDIEHEDLGFAEVFYDNGANDVKPDKIDDKNYKDHGTHVAGTMAAKGNNDEGICGVYPYGDGLLYCVSDSGVSQYNENGTFHSSTMCQKISYSELILRNVKVINQSLGFNWYKPEVYKDGYNYDSVEKLYNDLTKDYSVFQNEANALSDFFNRLLEKNYDFVLVSAAGNDSNIKNDRIIDGKYSSWLNLIDESYKDVYDRIIVVGAVDSSYSIRNTSNSGFRVDIFAPGEDIYSSVPGNKYDIKSGTSMASPHVAGVCADVWSVNNYLTGAEVKEIVCNSTIDNVVAYTYTDDKGNTHDKGVVDANKAVAEAYNRLVTSGRVKKEPENGAILGWVVEKDNKDNKIKEATVTATVKDADDGEIYSAKTDEYGHFELILPKGDYTLTVQDKDKKYKKFTVDIKDIKNGEVLYLDYWIELEKKLTKAEKYAKIVMDNEDIWLEPMNEINFTNQEPFCWFEDLDFDGNLEFIVGGCNMGTQGGINFTIYKISGSKMIKQNSPWGKHISSTDNSALIAPEPGLQAVGAEVIKTKKGTYKYLFPSSMVYIGRGTGISELSFFENCLNYKKIGSYWANQGTITYSAGNEENTSKEKLVSYINDYFEGTTRCITNIGTIPCTEYTKHYDADFYDSIKSGNAQLSDGQTAIVSSCYNFLSDKEKKEALIRSYKAYSIKNTEDTSLFYNKICNELEDIEWKTAYENYINQGNYTDLSTGFIKNSEVETISYEDARFSFAYIDDNDIPELLISSGYSVHILTVKDEEVTEIITDNEQGDIGWYGSLSIVERKGLFLDDYQRMGTYTTPVYKLSNGNAVLESDIAYYCTSAGEETFYINDKQVTVKEYLEELKKWNLNTFYTEQNTECEITPDNWININVNNGYTIDDIHQVLDGL